MIESVAQFEACVRSLVPPAERATLGARLPEVRDEVEAWFAEFRVDIGGGRYGYVGRARARQCPELEDRAREIVEKIGVSADPSHAGYRPTLCLSHDIDYLRPTLQMHLKRVIASRKLGFSPPGDFLDSIEQMLCEEKQVTGETCTTTVFLSLKEKAPRWKQRLTQWLIDPSYDEEEPLFVRLIGLLKEYRCELGIHGSLFSIEESMLKRERRRLEVATGVSVKVGRQHWLNLPGPEPLAHVRAAGISVDSTLGWNGGAGFRAGMARPFPLLTSKGVLWEVPMVLMDGPLFDDLKLNRDQAVDRAISLLDHVFRRQGTVAINWHDRAAHPEYDWFGAYCDVLKWAKEKGFRFQTISQSVADYERSYDA